MKIYGFNGYIAYTSTRSLPRPGKRVERGLGRSSKWEVIFPQKNEFSNSWTGQQKKEDYYYCQSVKDEVFKSTDKSLMINNI